MSRLSMIAFAGAAVSLLAPAWADVPPAMDRVPQGTMVVITIRNAAQFKGNVEGLIAKLGLPEGAADMGPLNQMLSMPGLDSDGSVALAMLGLEQGENGEPPVVIVAPVEDYGAFATGLGGTGEGVEEVEIEGDASFIKDLGGGFAAVGPERATVEAFAGEPGQGARFTTLMGPNGAAVADGADVFVVADIAALGPAMKAGMEEAKANFAAMAEMGGPGAAQLAVAEAFMDEFIRDGQAGVIGLNVRDTGVKLDFGAQFKEGSEWAGYFAQAEGKPTALLGSVPNLRAGYLFAFAMDTSAPGIKRLFKDVLEAAQAADPEAAGMMPGGNLVETIDKVDGTAFVMGTSPGGFMGGLFVNTLMYVKTSDPDGYIASMRELFTGMDGKTAGGVTYDTSFEQGTTEVSGTKADAWSMRMQFDPADPAAQQGQMAQAMMFGPAGGPSGFVAKANNGVLVTYSKNSELLSEGLTAAKGGAGLAGEPGIAAVSKGLPEGRTAEGYIGVKGILEMALGAMAMFGGPVGDFEVPADLPPIGMGGTTKSGGARLLVSVPVEVLAAFSELGQSFGPGPGMEMEEMEEDAGQERF
jgi:hypothetical protein